MSHQRIIIDTDPGVDDAAAILLALASPELEVLGISVVGGNVPLEATVANACKIMALSNRADVPIYAGAPGPLIREQVYGKYAHIGAFSDQLVPATDIKPEAEHAVSFLIRTTRNAAEVGDPITICAIGPLTNIALALVQHPDVARGIKQIVSMGGAFTALGHRTPWAEFNIYADPHAAEIVYGSGVPLVIMPLDTTFQALLTRQHIEGIQAAAGAPGRALANLLLAFDRSDIGRFGRPGGPIHDATTIAWLLKPELFQGRKAAIGVQVTGRTAGYTYADYYGKTDRPPTSTIMHSVDEQGFIDLLFERLNVYSRSNDDLRALGG
ncbi:nucleoside hydrolase [Microvirga vignae]|uniref:Nucleoside hydrolase n=1 Tax=Microvirga vignae TaxID=1225564 RepID=A0A0H1RFF3_9HYPH|nr:nucleoside hydrolase [Microvirga vignae]KLK91302.1 nucleoside hydrolase [Microvirga vignae]